MLHLLLGRARTGKSGRVLETIRNLGDSGKQILLVPEHASHQAEVDLCTACGDTASRHAEVLSFRRLADRVLTLTGGMTQVSLDAGGKLLTLQKCLMELAPVLSVYRRPSRKAVFLREMLSLFDELRCYEVSPETLYEQAQEIRGGAREKLLDISLIYGAYESRLRERGLRDRMTKLAENLQDSGYGRDKDIFLDGFTYFNAQERRVLGILLQQARSVTVTLLGEERGEGLFDAAVKTRGQLERLAREAGCPVTITLLQKEIDGPIGHLERHFFGQQKVYEGDSQAIQLRQAETVLSEVEMTAADIRRLVAEGKARYRDITVAARNMGDYEGSIETVFARWDIPVYLSRRNDILQKPVMSLLGGVLNAVSNGYEYEDLFRALKTGLGGLSAQECDVLENYVLKWEIHGGMWLRDTAWQENPEGYGAAWGEAEEQRLALVNALRERVRAPLLALSEGLKAAETAREQVEALYGYMEQISLRETLDAQMNAQAEAGRLQEAEETAQLWTILCGVLDQFVEILGDERMDLDTFVRLFRQVAGEYSVGTIPASLDQVNVSEITRNDRHTVKYLFLLGANDHVLPSPGSRGGILTDDDREELLRRGVELAPSGMDQMAIELQNLYAALIQPRDRLTVSYPISDASGAALRPAFVVGRLQTLFPQLRLQRESIDKEFRLTAPIPALEEAEKAGALRDFFLASRPEAVAAMDRAASAGRGALSREAVRALYGERIHMSASRLERMRTCHFAYFMEYGLRAKARAAAAFDAPQIGTFLHFLLENVTREAMEQGGFSQVKDEVLHALTEKYIQQFIEQELGDMGKKSARFRYLFYRLRETARSIVETVAEEQRHSDFVPMAFELSFGSKGALPAVSIQAPGGNLRVGGKVDRVDGWVRDGKLYLRVVDYKSGKKKFELGAVRMGLDIQMLLYLFALQKSGKRYFGKEIEPAGVLYLPARDDILSEERNITPEALQKEREKAIRRSGLLLAEPEVLRAMEHEALTEPHYLPMNVKKDGSISGDLASAEQLGLLGRYIEKLLGEIAAEVRGGSVDADPCCKNEQEIPCRYCAWADACHFTDGRRGDRLRFIPNLKADEFWESIEEGQT